jgi:hypothetical protein
MAILMGPRFAANCIAHEQGNLSVLLNHYVEETASWPLVNIRLREIPGTQSGPAVTVSMHW